MSGRFSGPERPTPAPLTDADLTKVPIATRDDPDGLTPSAKENYRIRRRMARGGRESFVRRETLARELGLDMSTVDRSTAELVDKGYLERTNRYRNRVRIVLLCRGRHDARHEALEARHDASVRASRRTGAAPIEEQAKNHPGFQPGGGSSSSAAASPAPPEGGSAAGKKRTGWRFQRSTSGSGTFVRDPEGTDRPPSGYFTPPDEAPGARGFPAEELPDTGPLEVRERRAVEMRQRVVEMFGGPPPGERLGPGRCDDCSRDRGRVVEADVRERYGRFVLCLECLERRHAATTIVVERLNVGTPASVWTGWRRCGKSFVRDRDGVARPWERRKRASVEAPWERWRREAA